MDEKQPICSAIAAHSQKRLWPGYTPGHKGGQALTSKLSEEIWRDPFAFDLGFMGPLDDFHSPKTIIAEAESHAARVFGAAHSFLLTNGSSGGLMALMLATQEPSDVVIVPRNVHRAIMFGMILTGAIPHFVDTGFEPATGLPLPLNPADVTEADLASAQSLFSVSPTYHGLTGHISELANKTKNSGTLFFVDEAHGAHLPFGDELPDTALRSGAHAVVQSTHKTLQAFTPGAMLHLAKDGPSPERVRAALRIMQSSSANYGLLASLDSSRAFMEMQGHERIAQVVQALAELRNRLNTSGLIDAPLPDRILHESIAAIDPTKLFLDFRCVGLSGPAAAKALYEQAGIGVELSTETGVLLIITAADTRNGLSDLGDRLLAFAEKLSRHVRSGDTPTMTIPVLAYEMAVSPRDAYFGAVERIAFSAAGGRIAAESIVPYPPGVPSVWPGERIASVTSTFRAAMQACGASVQCSDPSLETVLVLK